MRAILALVLLSATGLIGQGSGSLHLAGGTEPKASPADYVAHAMVCGISIGAEYTVHSFSGRGQTFIASDYLVVEVAVFPAAGATAEIGSRTFRLRVNGKNPIYPDAPGFVAASVKYPDWERRVNLEGQAGVGDADVIVGRPQTVGRFPGDPRPAQTRLPRAPKAPEPDDRRGIEEQEPAQAADVIPETVLPEGSFASPVSGYLYFRHKGKLKSIKSLQLVYQVNTGSVTLALK